MFVPLSYPRSGLGRNGLAEGGLERLLGEALPGQSAGRAEPATEPGGKGHGPLGLRLERRDRVGHRGNRDAALLEIGANERIPVPPLGQHPCAFACEAALVEIAGGREPAQNLVPALVPDTRPLEQGFQLLRGAVPARERAHRSLERSSLYATASWASARAASALRTGSGSTAGSSVSTCGSAVAATAVGSSRAETT